MSESFDTILFELYHKWHSNPDPDDRDAITAEIREVLDRYERANGAGSAEHFGSVYDYGQLGCEVCS